MPLMVDPSSGSLVGVGSLLTYGASATGVLVPISSASLEYRTTGISLASASAPSITSSSGVNKTLLVMDQAADQMSTNESIPRNLMLAFGAILLFCLFLTHARFLARLFASFHPRSVTNPTQKSSRGFRNRQDRNDAFVTLEDEGSRRFVGGGDLWKGWFLRSSKSRQQNFGMEKRNPFSDPWIHPLTPPVKPTLYPPPHITPPLHHLPHAPALLYTSPFAKFPTNLKHISLATLYIITTYLIVILFALLWQSNYAPSNKTTGYGANYLRPAFVALTHVPVVVALGVRGNIIGQCVGKGYERLGVFHKVVGRVMFVCMTLHMAFYMHKWVIANKFSVYFFKTFVYFGLTAYLSVILIVITSLPIIRKMWYGIFEVCHFVGLLGMLVGLSFHVDAAVPFTLSAAFIYIFSIVVSISKTRLAHAELVALASSNTTLVKIPSLTTGWRAGQHVRLRVTSLPFPNCLQGHPFTIASAPDSSGLMLLAKVSGDWTSQLFEHALKVDSDTPSELGQLGSLRLNTRVLLEGPYGGLGNTLLPSFSSILLIAGGSGISHSLGIAHDLLLKSPTGVIKSRTIELIWIVRTPQEGKPMMETLLTLVRDAKDSEERSVAALRRGVECAKPFGVRVAIYLTRCRGDEGVDLVPPEWGCTPGVEGGMVFDLNLDGDGGLDGREEGNPFGDGSESMEMVTNEMGLQRKLSAADKEKHIYLFSKRYQSSTSSPSPFPSTPYTPSSTSPLTSHNPYSHIPTPNPQNQPQSLISIHPSKPNFQTIIDKSIASTLDRHRQERTEPCGVCVVSCGPVGMVADVRRRVGEVEGWKRKAVGGIEVEEEGFGL